MRPPPDLRPLIKSLQSPRTLRELVLLHGVDRRTIYRWFVRLEAGGQCVERVGLERPTRYRLS